MGGARLIIALFLSPGNTENKNNRLSTDDSQNQTDWCGSTLSSAFPDGASFSLYLDQLLLTPLTPDEAVSVLPEHGISASSMNSNMLDGSASDAATADFSTFGLTAPATPATATTPGSYTIGPGMLHEQIAPLENISNGSHEKLASSEEMAMRTPAIEMSRQQPLSNSSSSVSSNRSSKPGRSTSCLNSPGSGWLGALHIAAQQGHHGIVEVCMYLSLLTKPVCRARLPRFSLQNSFFTVPLIAIPTKPWSCCSIETEFGQQRA